MGIIFDIIIVAIFVLNIFVCYKKGLVKLAVGLIAVLASIILALILILLAIVLWVEFSFFLAGLGIVLLGISAMLYLHK